MEDISKIENFHYKSGTFCDGDGPPMRIRRKVFGQLLLGMSYAGMTSASLWTCWLSPSLFPQRKVRERSSSESSWMERGEGADTPDSLHRLTPSQPSKRLPNNQTTVLSHSDGGDDSTLSIPPDASSSAHWSLNNGTVKSHETLWVEYNPYQNSENKNLIGATCWFCFSPPCSLCSKCGVSYNGTWYDKKRKRPVCPPCWGIIFIYIFVWSVVNVRCRLEQLG